MRRNLTLRVRASVPAELGRLRSPAWFRSEFEAACARHGQAWLGMAGRDARFLSWVWWLLLLMLYAVAFHVVLTTPVVSLHWPDGACVRADPPHRCEALPVRYTTEWVGEESER